jgi:hypothetical protein
MREFDAELAYRNLHYPAGRVPERIIAVRGEQPPLCRRSLHPFQPLSN